jgi:hypothetical protein
MRNFVMPGLTRHPVFFLWIPAQGRDDKAEGQVMR